MHKLNKTILVFVFAGALSAVSAYARSTTDLDVELKGPRGGGGVRASDVKQNIENVAYEISRASALESQGAVTQTVYNSDGTLSQVTFKDGTQVSYGYAYNSEGLAEACTISTNSFEVIFSSPDGRNVDRVGFSAKDERGQKETVFIVMDSAGVRPTMYDISHKPLPFELISGINKSLDGLAKAKREALAEYKSSTSRYYDEVESAMERNKKSLAVKGIDVDMLLKESKKEGVPEDVRRRVIDETVGYIYAVASKDKTGNTAKEFIDLESSAKKNILNGALAIYEAKIKEALAYINKVIDGLLKSKLALFMSSDKEKIDAIINLPEIKKATPESPEVPKK